MRRCLLIFMLGVVPMSVNAELSDEEYRAEVVGYSLGLQAANNVVDAAVASLSVEQTSRLPKLDMGGLFSERFRSFDGQRNWSFSLEPKVVQTLYGGGVVNSRIREAELGVEVAECDAEYTMLEVLYAADYAFWNMWSMERYRAAMAQYVDVIERESLAIEYRYSEGYISKGDLLMIQSRLSEAEYELIAADQSLLMAQNNLNILRGVAPEEQVVLVSESVDSIVPMQRVAMDQVFRSRPDYEAAKLGEERAAEATNVVRGGYNPKLVGGVGGSWRTYVPNSNGATYLDGSIYAELSVPIFHFGERRKAVAVSQSREIGLAITTAQLRDDIIRDESNAWITLLESRAQMDSAKRSLSIAGENLDISTYSYNEGLVSIVDLMQAQISWIQIYTNAINAEYSYRLAIAAYRKVVGEYSLEK